MNKNLFLQLSGLILGLLLVMVGILIFEKPYQFQGSLIDPPMPAPDFDLNSAKGTRFRLQDFQGKIILLYFGYTFCPDVCPTTLYDLARARESLGEKKDEIMIAMVTVDPERDSLEKLGAYVSTFDPSFYGLSGDVQTLETVWTSYGVYREKKIIDSGTAYLVDHTARVYVIDRQGNLRITFPFGMRWEAIADDLAHLFDEQT